MTLSNTQRAIQLSQKTNQFNTTTQRYEKSHLAAIVEEGGDIVVIGLEDKFSGAENIGLIVLKPHPKRHGWGIVDNFLLSCRVLGRGLEPAILHWALAHAHRRGWNGLGGSSSKQSVTRPCERYSKMRILQEGPSGEWIKSSNHVPKTPNWLTVIDETVGQTLESPQGA